MALGLRRQHQLRFLDDEHFTLAAGLTGSLDRVHHRCGPAAALQPVASPLVFAAAAKRTSIGRYQHCGTGGDGRAVVDRRIRAELSGSVHVSDHLWSGGASARQAGPYPATTDTWTSRPSQRSAPGQ